MLSRNPTRSTQPVAVLGAGELVSHLHRGENSDEPADYRFSVFRIAGGLQATHELRACDLLDLVKLCQVLAFAIDDDGWIQPDVREQLRELVADLDEITRKWSKAPHV